MLLAKESLSPGILLAAHYARMESDCSCPVCIILVYESAPSSGTFFGLS
jgi:hypothetical protein